MRSDSDAATPFAQELPAEVLAALAPAVGAWLAELQWRLEAAEARAAAAEARVVELEAENAALKERVRVLEARLGQDSSNSSRPPSSDTFRGGQLRKKGGGGGRPGGQPGHSGHTRSMVPPERVDEVREVVPERCGGCGASLAGLTPLWRPLVRQVIDIPAVRPQVTEYRLHRLTCRTCGTVNQAAPPAEAATATGPTLTSCQRSRRTAENLTA